MRKILTDAIAVANAAARTVSFAPARIRRVRLLQPDSKWLNPLFVGGYDFDHAAAGDHQGGREAVPAIPAPARSTRAPPSSTCATGVTPAMVMRLPDVGSQYLFAHLRREREAVRRRQDL